MKINFHRFRVGDVEDPEIYAAEPIRQWQETEQGQWVMQNAHSLTYVSQPDETYWGYRYTIRGEITDPKKITEYFLKWDQQKES